VKPANLFLVKTGSVKLLDFGLAVTLGRAGEITRSRFAVGTPAYMAPEQAQGGRKEDPRTDVWGLGAMLHAALALRPPFAADGPAAMLVRIVSDRPDPLPASVPASLRDTIARALEKDPGRRFQSMSLFERALRGERTVQGTVRARAPSPPRPAPPAPAVEPDRTTGRILTASAAAIGVAVLLSVVLFGTLALRLASRDAAEEEEPPVPPGFSRHEGDGWSFVASSALSRDPAPPPGTMVLLAGIGTETVSFGISAYPGDPATFIRQDVARVPGAQTEIVRVTDRPAGRDGFDAELVVRSGGQNIRLIGRTFVVVGDAYSLSCAALEPDFERLRGRCDTTIRSLAVSAR
jgi:hypothetical protein